MSRSIFSTVLVGISVLGLTACIPPSNGDDNQEKKDTGPVRDTGCTEKPTCKDGDRKVATCPADASCYTNRACGAAVRCLERNRDASGDIGPTPDATCLAYPVCDRGDREVEKCPQGANCYTRSVCGNTIKCVRGGGDAGPAPDSGGSCPPEDSRDPDASCLAVLVCCVNENTGEKCTYANPCVAPKEPGSEWTCGQSVCARDAG